MTHPLVLLVDPRRTFREAFKAEARGFVRVLAFPDIPAAMAALDRFQPSAVCASLIQAEDGTNGAEVCSIARTSLGDGVFVAYGHAPKGKLPRSAASNLRETCELSSVLVDDVSGAELLGEVCRLLGVDLKDDATDARFFARVGIALRARVGA